MRPSNKSRSRNKSGNNNHNNSRRNNMGNVMNRVFDSAGPEGKVRGTPQQIIDKYQSLARDAQLSGDRVAAESFLQHSEHYSRLLGEAMQQQMEQRQQQQEREAQQQTRHVQNNPPNENQNGAHSDNGQNRQPEPAQDNRQMQQPAPQSNDALEKPVLQKPVVEPENSGLTTLGDDATEDKSRIIETPEGNQKNVDTAPAKAENVDAEPVKKTRRTRKAAIPAVDGEKPAPIKRARTRAKAKVQLEQSSEVQTD